MRHTSIEWDYGRRRSSCEQRGQELSALRTWLQGVGKELTTWSDPIGSRTIVVQDGEEHQGEDALLQEAISRALAGAADDSAARAAVRSAHINFAMHSRYGRLKKQLSKRSAIFYQLFTDTQANQIVHGDSPALVVKKKLLFYVGMVFMWIGLVAFALLVPCFLASTVLGVLFPVIQLLRGVISEGAAHISVVSVFLTATYCCLILVLLSLIPLVGEFQLFRTDVVNLTNFPPIFYEIDTIKELHKRFVHEVDDRLLDKTLDQLFGADVALLTKSFLEPSTHKIDEITLKTFQHRVLSVSV